MAKTPIRQSIEFIGRNGIGEVSRLGLGHKDVIPLWFGESDLVTPDFIRNAAKQALDEGQTFYTFSAGHPRLRQAIVDWTKRHYGLALDIDRVTVPGAAMLAVITALQCTVETGDEVIVISPVWPNIFFAVQAVGGKPVFVENTSRSVSRAPATATQSLIPFGIWSLLTKPKLSGTRLVSGFGMPPSLAAFHSTRLAASCATARSSRTAAMRRVPFQRLTCVRTIVPAAES